MLFKVITYSANYDYSFTNAYLYVDAVSVDGYTAVCLCGVQIKPSYNASQQAISAFGIYSEDNFVVSVYTLDESRNLSGDLTVQILYINNAQLNGNITSII